MAYNKVTYKGEVIMDITDSTVTEETLGEGVVAYGANGERIVGINTGGSSFIDVLTLPTENIRTGMFYRPTKATLVYEGSREEQHTVYCVDGLPETGEPVSNVEQSTITAYVNINTETVHGYIDDTLSAGVGIPVGWYGEELFEVFGVPYGGIIYNPSESVGKDALCCLIERRMYFYDNGWCEAAFGYELAPEFELCWDGVIGDRFTLDISALNDGTTSYLVKVSDRVFAAEELIGATYSQSVGYEYTLQESDIADGATAAGALTIDGGGIAVVYNADATNAAFGTPAGYITNGTYFVYIPDYGNHTDRLVAPSKVVRIDAKYIDFDGSFATVAKSGDFYDLENRPTIYTDVVRYSSQSLGTYQKQTARQNIDVYSKSEVDQKIADAIGFAIGGSY